ncbi:FAD-binding oxidoreductase [Ahrensia sp. R2A130]|uniref:NAD(P)/FAD-dependent oxidoreductase n=1 Tax=Ahrensia sp. R2A130 TaxID=744979 RepID=UPI0001E0D82E|nr:FAD-dependent oxidoreductase [Ahrensia sp. R2A130]EFL89791.1 putative glycine oxidase [Ahrensia sp. R2A130]
MIVVVGGGIAGLSVAAALADAGADVTVLEAGRIAGGASGVATSYLEPRLGQTHMRRLEWEALSRWENYAGALEERTGLTVGFRKEGELKVTTAANYAAFEKDMEKRAAQDWPLERLNVAQALAMEPALAADIVDAAFLPQVRWVTGVDVCRALAVQLRDGGHEVRENCAVKALSEDGDGIIITTTSGQAISAERVILANGMGTASITGLPDDIPESRPVRGVNLILGMDGLAQPIQHLVKHHRGNICPRTDADGRSHLIVGTTYEPGEASLEPDDDVIERLYANAEPILPQVRKLPRIAVRAGLRTKVGDGNLNLGRSQQMRGLFWSLSHAGAGYLRAPVVASELAQFVLTGEPGEWTGICTRGA